MSRIPYFAFYPADFMNGVRGLSAQEVGVYTMLLCRIYEESGPVEYHALRLSTYCGMRQATFEKTVEKLLDLGKLRLVGGMLSNPRAEVEIAKRAHDLEIASRAGKVSAQKRQQKQQQEPTDVQRTFNHTDTDTDKYSDTNVSGVSAAETDPVKELFGAGVRILGSCGVPEAKARQMVGKWRKEHPNQDGQILEAIMDCGRAGAVDPVPWITARLRPTPTVNIRDIFAAINAEAKQ